MHPAREDRFHLRHNGQVIEVELEPKFMEPIARLLINDELIDQQSTWPTTTQLQGPGLIVFVEWTLLSRPQRAWAVFQDEKSHEEDVDGDSQSHYPEHDLTPPPGSWAERVARFADDHPNVYASRHVIKATLQALLGILGIGAILWGLLPRFDVDIPFPDIELGDWIRSIVPGWVQRILQLPQRAFTWLFGWVPDIMFFDRFIDWIRNIGFPPDWLKSVVSSARYWVPVLIAVGVALNEIERRNKKASAESGDASSQDSETTDEVQGSPDDTDKGDANPNSD